MKLLYRKISPRWWTASFTAVAVALVISTVAYFAVPKLVSEAMVKARIDAHISRWTGGAYHLHDNARITIAPGFDVTVSGAALVHVGNTTAAPLLTSDTGTASLRVWPLLFGRVEIANLAIARPHVVLRPQAATSPPLQVDSAPTQMKPLADVMLTDGTIRVGGVEGVSDVDLRLMADEASDAIAIKGALALGMRRMHIEMQLDDPGAFVSGAGIQGTLTLRPGQRTDTPQDESAASDWGLSDPASDMLLQVASALGISNFGFGTLTAQGTFTVTQHTIAISDATFSLGGVEMRGDVRISSTDKHILAKLMELPRDAAAALADAQAASDGHWGNTPLDMAWLNGVDLDVDLTGEDLSVGKLALDDAALSLMLRDGGATVDVTGTQEALGTAQAALKLTHSAGGQAGLAFSGRADDLRVDKAMRVLSAIGPPPLVGTMQMPEGMMNGAFDLAANGRTLGGLVDSFNGSVRAQLTDGSLAGTDLVATLETLVRGRKFMTEKDGPLIPAAGRTRFDQMDARIDFAAGEAIVSGIHIAGERFGIKMLGAVQLAEGRMNVGGDAVLLPEPGTEDEMGDTLVNLPFGVGGTVFEPVVAPGVPTVTTAQVSPDAQDR